MLYDNARHHPPSPTYLLPDVRQSLNIDISLATMLFAALGALALAIAGTHAFEDSSPLFFYSTAKQVAQMQMPTIISLTKHTG